MVIVMRVECPRCHRIHTAFDGDPDVLCTCHLFCEEGNEPSDCNLVDHQQATVDAWKGNWNFPQGMHLGRSKADDNTQARVYWCTIHEHFVAKVLFLIPVEWKRYQHQRLPKKLRFNRDV